VNYRHAYHAGNFADVLKHIALVAILLHLRKKDAPFAVIDTHAGRGLYNLAEGEAAKTGEAGDGILKLKAEPQTPAAYSTYLDLAHEVGKDFYPGSPLIAARLLRLQDRLVAIEKHEDECSALTEALRPSRKARVVCADGYERLNTLLPPPERRGVVLIDPPYEAPDEFQKAAHALANAHRRFATGIYLLWYPIKSAADADALCGEVKANGISRALRIELDIAAAKERPDGLHATGLLVINPPYQFDTDMDAVLKLLAAQLGRNASASARLQAL
jgi:23S rRNA (adenine2030-N6)-methyltransferase